MDKNTKLNHSIEASAIKKYLGKKSLKISTYSPLFFFSFQFVLAGWNPTFQFYVHYKKKNKNIPVFITTTQTFILKLIPRFHKKKI